MVAGEYLPIARGETEQGQPALASRVLELELHVTGDGLRFFDPAAAQYLSSHAQAEARAAAEAERAAAAEARVAELEAKLRDRGAPSP